MIKRRNKKNFHPCIFSYIFGFQNPGSGLDPDPDWIRIGSGLNPDSLEMLDPDPYPHSDPINPDPKHWIQILLSVDNLSKRITCLRIIYVLNTEHIRR
jgi:hypothetical protein